MRSMTAFATITDQDAQGTLVWELRSVNHRYLDISLRLPDEFRSLESAVRDRIAGKICRGKLDCNLRFKPATQSASDIVINESIVKSVIEACQKINVKLHQPSEINPLDVLRWPGVVNENENDFQALTKRALTLFDKVLAEFIACREREGKRILDVIKQRCDAMQTVVAAEIGRRPEITRLAREKLLARINELQQAVDMNRFEQEVAFLLQKMDVDEELDRLKSHFAELDDIFARQEAVGRRLDFIMQELNREANTLGSKSVDIQTTQASVELKVLIEQMREQVQNIE